MPGVTKFDTPAQAQFMNTYVPIPFQEMQQAVATRQGRLDENLARMDAANAAAQNLNYISNSVDEEYIKGVVQPGMESLVTEFSTQDLSDPTVYNALRSKMSTTLDKSRIKDIQSSYTAHQANLQTVGKLKAQGKYQEALDLMDPTRGGKFDSRTGVFQYQSEAALDIRKAAEQYFNNLKADTGWNPETGEIWSGISDAKIQESATENIRTFLDSKEGEQAVRIAAHRNGVDYNKLSKERKEAYAMDVLMEVGDEFGYSSTTPMPGFASYMKGQQPQGQEWGVPTYHGSAVKVADNPELGMPGETGLQAAPVTSLSVPGLTTQTVTSKADQAIAEKRVQQEIDDSRERWIPNRDDVTDEEYVPQLNKAMNALNVQSPAYMPIGTAALGEIKNQIYTNRWQTNITLYDSEGVSSVMKVDEVLKKLKWSDKEYDEFLQENNPQLTMDGPESMMYAYQIGKDRHGKRRVMMMSSSDQMGAMGNDSYQLQQKQNNLDETPFMSKYGVLLRTVPDFNYEEGRFEFNTEEGEMVNGVFMRTGDAYIKGRPATLNELKKLELGDMMESGIIGTDINYITGAKPRGI